MTVELSHPANGGITLGMQTGDIIRKQTEIACLAKRDAVMTQIAEELNAALSIVAGGKGEHAIRKTNPVERGLPV